MHWVGSWVSWKGEKNTTFAITQTRANEVATSEDSILWKMWLIESRWLSGWARQLRNNVTKHERCKVALVTPPKWRQDYFTDWSCQTSRRRIIRYLFANWKAQHHQKMRQPLPTWRETQWRQDVPLPWRPSPQTTPCRSRKYEKKVENEAKRSHSFGAFSCCFLVH